MRRQTQTVRPFRSFIYSFPTQQDCVLPVLVPRPLRARQIFFCLYKI